MAITTRYFSTTGNGGADGTTWADRAALFSAGNWSTVITGHDFSTNSLKCLIGPGNYTCSQGLTNTVITTDPSIALPLLLCGCDSSGAILAVPDPDWTSDQPAWDDSTLPVIATTTNIATLTVAGSAAMLLKFTASGRNGGVITGTQSLLWCVVENSTANANASATTTVVNPFGCVLTCSGSSYDFVMSVGGNAENCRIEGNSSASSGNRRGVVSAGTATHLTRCTVVNNVGEGVLCTSASAAQSMRLYRCVIANNGSTGIKGTSTGSQSTTFETHGCMVTGNVVGIDGVSDGARWIVSCNRLRDNTTNIQGIGNYPTDLDNYTTDSDDSTEYVAAGADGDFRIKNTASSIWGKGYGVSDEPSAGGGGGLIRHPGMSGGLNG